MFSINCKNVLSAILDLSTGTQISIIKNMILTFINIVHPYTLKFIISI